MGYYRCEKCDMEINKLVCHQCNTELSDKTIEKNDKTVHVAECPKCHGMVKSPQCCGTDMTSTS